MLNLTTGKKYRIYIKAMSLMIAFVFLFENIGYSFSNAPQNKATLRKPLALSVEEKGKFSSRYLALMLAAEKEEIISFLVKNIVGNPRKYVTQSEYMNDHEFLIWLTSILKEPSKTRLINVTSLLTRVWRSYVDEGGYDYARALLLIFRTFEINFSEKVKPFESYIDDCEKEIKLGRPVPLSPDIEKKLDIASRLIVTKIPEKYPDKVEDTILALDLIDILLDGRVDKFLVQVENKGLAKSREAINLLFGKRFNDLSFKEGMRIINALVDDLRLPLEAHLLLQEKLWETNRLEGKRAYIKGPIAALLSELPVDAPSLKDAFLFHGTDVALITFAEEHTKGVLEFKGKGNGSEGGMFFSGGYYTGHGDGTTPENYVGWAHIKFVRCALALDRLYFDYVVMKAIKHGESIPKKPPIEDLLTGQAVCLVSDRKRLNAMGIKTHVTSRKSMDSYYTEFATPATGNVPINAFDIVSIENPRNAGDRRRLVESWRRILKEKNIEMYGLDYGDMLRLILSKGKDLEFNQSLIKQTGAVPSFAPASIETRLADAQQEAENGNIEIVLLQLENILGEFAVLYPSLTGLKDRPQLALQLWRENNPRGGRHLTILLQDISRIQEEETSQIIAFCHLVETIRARMLRPLQEAFEARRRANNIPPLTYHAGSMPQWINEGERLLVIYEPGRIVKSLGTAKLYPTYRDYANANPSKTMTEEEWVLYQEEQIQKYIEGPARILVRRILAMGGWPETSNAYGPGLPGVGWYGRNPAYGENHSYAYRYYTLLTLEDVIEYKKDLITRIYELKAKATLDTHNSDKLRQMEEELEKGLPVLEERICTAVLTNVDYFSTRKSELEHSKDANLLSTEEFLNTNRGYTFTIVEIAQELHVDEAAVSDAIIQLETSRIAARITQEAQNQFQHWVQRASSDYPRDKDIYQFKDTREDRYTIPLDVDDLAKEQSLKEQIKSGNCIIIAGQTYLVIRKLNFRVLLVQNCDTREREVLKLAQTTVEAEFLREARHRNILRVDRVVTDEKDRIVIFTKYHGPTNFYEYVKILAKKEMTLPEYLAVILPRVVDIGEALEYLLSKGFEYQDYSPNHIIIDEETGEAIQTDFGKIIRRDNPRGNIINLAYLIDFILVKKFSDYWIFASSPIVDTAIPSELNRIARKAAGMIPGENYAILDEMIQDLKNFLNELTKLITPPNLASQDWRVKSQSL